MGLVLQDIFLLFKPQDAKVADDQYNDVAKCSVNQPFIPGYFWVPVTHIDKHQTDSSKVHIKRPEKERTFVLTRKPGTHSIFKKCIH